MMNLDFVLFMLFLGLMIATCASKCPRIRRVKNLRPKYQSGKRIVYFRCKRGFDLIGENSAVCNGDKWSAEYPICIAPGCRALDYDHNVLDVTYTYRGSLATFQCKAGYVMEDEDNRVYCNKIEWNKPVPICTKNSLKKSCDYEDGICGWTQDKSDEFDWEIHSKETSTRFTGPSYDHTYGNASEGHYLYIESSSPRHPGDKARLLSPLYNFKEKSVCFEFWYHMLCSSLKEVGTLEVYAIPENEFWSNKVPLITITGDHGDNWNQERLQIQPIKGSFRIILQATRALNHQNDIAIDDIRLWEGVCDDAPNFTYPMPPPTIPSKVASSSESKPVEITGKETMPTTLSMQPQVIKSTVNTPVSDKMPDEEIQPITTQSTSNKISVTQIRSSTEAKPTEKGASPTNGVISGTGDVVSQKTSDSSSMDFVTVAEDEDTSNKFTMEQSSVGNVEGEISAKSSGGKIENYTPLAIGITVALLFGIGVIFFIVWIWARSQDRKRALAEDEEETQPITNAGSTNSLQNGL